MKAYSQDLRERILQAVDQAYPRAEIVQFFGISLSTLKRYLKQRREEGHVRPKAIPGRSPKKRAQVEAGVLPQLQVHDDATLEQHCDLWEQTHGERVSRWTMSRAIKKLGWTRKKKSLGATERNEEERAAWRANASKLPTESLVVIDECGSNIALTPLYARAPKGERARGSVPRNRGKNITLIYATQDGGKTWSKPNIPAITNAISTESHGPFWRDSRSGTLYVLYLPNVSNAHQALTTYHTHDGGQNWTMGPSSPDVSTSQFALFFLNAREGWSLGIDSGGKYVVHHTGDGGKTWQVFNPTGLLQPPSEVVLDLKFL